MRIIFPHIPKCAGTSIRLQLAGRPNVHFDYLSHPTWRCREDKAIGLEQRRLLKSKLRGQNSWIVFGHFAADAYDDVDHDLKIILLRQPVERAASHFNYVKDLLPDTDVTRRRHAEVSLIKEGKMQFNEFCHLHHIKFFYHQYYIRGASEDERTLGLAFGDMRTSFRKIFEYTGIPLDDSVRMNANARMPDFEGQSLPAEEIDIYNRTIERRPR